MKESITDEDLKILEVKDNDLNYIDLKGDLRLKKNCRRVKFPALPTGQDLIDSIDDLMAGDSNFGE